MELQEDSEDTAAVVLPPYSDELIVLNSGMVDNLCEKHDTAGTWSQKNKVEMVQMGYLGSSAYALHMLADNELVHMDPFHVEYPGQDSNKGMMAAPKDGNTDASPTLLVQWLSDCGPA